MLGDYHTLLFDTNYLMKGLYLTTKSSLLTKRFTQRFFTMGLLSMNWMQLLMIQWFIQGLINCCFAWHLSAAAELINWLLFAFNKQCLAMHGIPTTLFFLDFALAKSQGITWVTCSTIFYANYRYFREKPCVNDILTPSNVGRQSIPAVNDVRTSSDIYKDEYDVRL